MRSAPARGGATAATGRGSPRNAPADLRSSRPRLSPRLAPARASRPPLVEAAPVAPAALELTAVAALPAETQETTARVDAAISAAAPAPVAQAPPARGFWVQLGAFREASGAESFQRRVAVEVEWLTSMLATFGDASFYRVQAGPYASRDEAQAAAARIRAALGLVPMIVERR